MESRPHATRLGALAGVIATLLLAACSDNPAGPGPGATSPLSFEYFIHPKIIGTEPGQRVRAGVLVGPDLCWQMGEAWVRHSADSLYLEGMARYEPQGACPQALAYDTLSVALPGLNPGVYFIVAGDLVDTLYVASRSELAVVSPTGGAFAAHGRIHSSLIPEACTTFACRGPFDEVSGAIENPSAPLPGSPSGRATGDLLGATVHCGQNDTLQLMHLRSFVAGPSYGDTQDLEFEYFMHPGSLAVGAADTLEAGVFVGANLCWEVLGATITLRGDSLLLRGKSIYHPPPDHGCPEALRYETLHLRIPPLAAGQYFLVAQDLVDTLDVATAAPRPPGEHFSAYGTLCPSVGTAARCAAPEFTSRAGFHVVEGDLVNPLPLIQCQPMVLTGTIVDRVPCEEIIRQMIQRRGHLVIPPNR